MEKLCIKLKRPRNVLARWEKRYLSKEKFLKAFVHEKIQKLKSKQEVQ